ncbi:hypothetical protein A2U01_0063549, partial [Trifolium medium]|nr:hypothetical protein [Trifolium medium]
SSMRSFNWVQSSVSCHALRWNMQNLVVSVLGFSRISLGGRTPTSANSALAHSWSIVSREVFNGV